MAQHLGAIPWNKGIHTGIVPKTAFKKGQSSPRKGKKAKPLSEEHKKAISEGVKNHLPSTAWREGEHISPITEFKEGYISENGFKKGDIPWNKGKHHLVGDKHPNWRGGITKERKRLMNQIEYKIWREAVFARDNWTCQICNNQGGELQADHIKPWALYPELRYAIDNGRTLCKSCHKKTDTWGARVFEGRKILRA